MEAFDFAVRDKKAAAKKEISTAYGDLLVSSFDLLLRAQALRVVMTFRTGITDGLQVLFGQRKPVDPFEVFDWMLADMRRLNQAWSAIWVVGSQEAVDLADDLVDACSDFLTAATARSSRLAPVKLIVGEKRTKAESDAYEQALRQASAKRVAFAAFARNELGKKAVTFALERAAQEGAAKTEVPQETPGGQARISK